MNPLIAMMLVLATAHAEIGDPSDVCTNDQGCVHGSSFLATKIQPAHVKHHALIANGLRVPHDENVNECNPTLPLPPFRESSFRSRLYPGVQVVVDVGGNIGEDIEAFLAEHKQASIFTFEPTPHFFSVLQDKFGKNPRVNISNVGASDTSGEADFIVEGFHGWGTSGVDHSIQGEHVQVHLQDVDDILNSVQQKIGYVPDVVNINCEGCEYAVMQRIVDRGWLGKIHYIQLSWHTPADIMDRVAKRCKIEQALLQSYDRTYYTHPGWVGWKLRDQK